MADKPSELEIRYAYAQWLKDLSHCASRQGARDEFRLISTQRILEVLQQTPTHEILRSIPLRQHDLRNLRASWKLLESLATKASTFGYTTEP